jgi:hypothetical protein
MDYDFPGIAKFVQARGFLEQRFQNILRFIDHLEAVCE